jgi:subtilisin family serine protease
MSLAAADHRSRTVLTADRSGEASRHTVVAIIDGGVHRTHPDVSDRLLPGIDLVDPCGAAANDPTGHGTTVAAVLSMTLDDHRHLVGDPTIDILPIRASTRRGHQFRWATATAILMAVEQGADVINLSTSSQSSRPSIPEWLAVRHALGQGAVIVAAAGNQAHEPARYPAAYPGVLSVTATAPDGTLAAYATHKGAVDVAAPGTLSWRSPTDGRRRRVRGTSYAAPVVSAAAALLKAQDPSLSPARIGRLLKSAARPLPESPTGPETRIGSVSVSGALRATAGMRLILAGA